MRKALLPLLGLGLVWAQIQIESSDLPAPGRSYRISQSRPQPGGPDFAATGAGYTWDFSQLVADTQLTTEWKSPLQVPQYVFNCGNASFQALLLKVADSFPSQGGVTIRDIYAFLRKGSSQMSVTGVGATINGFPTTQCYQDPDELYVLPLAYGDADSTTFWLRLNFSTTFGNATLAQGGYRLHRVDGYGTITTPYGTFPCLRLRRFVRQRDTIYLSNLPVQRQDTSYIELEWLSTGQGIPILRVQGQEVGGSFVPAIIQFKDTVRSASSLSHAESSLLIGPNPARDVLYLSKPGGRYEIYTLIGQRVAEGEVLPDRQIRLPADLPEGVYFLRVRREGNESWHRFVRLVR